MEHIMAMECSLSPQENCLKENSEMGNEKVEESATWRMAIFTEVAT